MSQTEVQLIKSGAVVDGDIVGMSSSKLSGTLPAVSGANLTNLPAANLSGALPAISGANLTNLPASGKILQVVEKKMTGDLQTSSTDYQEITGIQQSITLASTSSKVLVFVKLVQTSAYNSGTARRSRAQIYRGSVASGTSIDYNLVGSYGFSASSWSYAHGTNILQALDSPSTAGSVTYNVGVRVVDSGSWYVEVYGGAPSSHQSNMILMEIDS